MSTQPHDHRLMTLLLPAVLLLLFGALFLPAYSTAAEEICTVDKQGANDEPGQKDITHGCIDDSDLPDSFEISWNWDETSWNGANTGDGCILFDSEGDGDANYAACVQVGGKLAAMQNPPHPILYSCSDTRPDRCTGSAAIPGTPQSTCDVQVLPNDPFDENATNGPGDDHPNDTVAQCTIVMDDFGDETLEIIDNCSYPSASPNSDPSDCLVTPTGPTAITTASPIAAGVTSSELPAAAAAVLGLMMTTILIWKRESFR